MRTVPFQPLDPALYREVVRRALAEDLGWGDVTTEAIVPRELRARGVILVEVRRASSPASTSRPRPSRSSIRAASSSASSRTAIAASPATSSRSCAARRRRC